MHSILRTGAATAVLLAALTAQDTAKPDPAAELASLKARCDGAGDKAAAAAELRPEIEAFAKQHAGTDVGLSAKLYLLQQCWWLRSQKSETAMNEAADKLLAEILAEYRDNAQFDRIADYHYVFAADKKTALFEQLLAKSKFEGVRASMLLRLGMLEKNSKDAAVKARGKERFETLLRDYAKVPKLASTYGALADAHLHPLTSADLAIGKPAPEITGTGVDGKPMKLSDYRGKVLVVDFWGFW